MTLDIRLAGKDPRTQHFLDRCSQKFGGRFDYSNFEYVNAKTASEIICRIHGPFQQNPDKHLNSTHGCQVCALEARAALRKGVSVYTKPTLPVGEYLSRLNLPNHLSVNVDNYQGFTKGTVTLSCPDHGEKTYAPQSLLISEFKCVGCAQESFKSAMTKSFDDFVTKATILYDGKFLYPEQPYENRKSVVTIICPDHGEFTKKAQKHLTGQACYPCTLSEGIDAGKYPGGYSEKFFVDNPTMADHPATVYYMKIGDLYKIGVTIKEMRLRVNSLKHGSKKDVEVLDLFECTLYEAYTLEQRVLEENSLHRVRRSWSTELFDTDVLGSRKIEDYRGTHRVPIS